MRNLLLVEDNKLLSLMEAKHLRTAFPDVTLSIAKDVDEAILSARSNLPEVIIMDCKLPGGDCCSLLNDLLDISPKSTVVVTSAEPPDDLRGRSYRDKIFDILEKPFETEELVYVVGRALKATNWGIDSRGNLKNNERNAGLSVSVKSALFDRHQVLNVLSGILAGIRAFEADLEADYNEPEAIKDDVAEYIPRLVEMVNKVTGLIKMAGH